MKKIERQAEKILSLRQFWVVLNSGLGVFFRGNEKTRVKNSERGERNEFYKKM